MTAEKGVCPLCGADGVVGAVCRERVCSRAGVHLVPGDVVERGRLRPAAARDSMIGQRIEEYLVVDLVGAGGFGRVYLAYQLPIGLKGALKVMDLRDDPSLAEQLVKKFEGEAAALARLTHPNIVRLLRYGIHDGLPFLVMEYVEDGQPMHAVIAAAVDHGERLPPAVVRHVLRQLLNALEAAHDRGIVHRDIKPANVMLQKVAGDDHFVRVLDFGIAKFVEERTETSMTVGTPMYMAPEQLDRRNIGPWTDLYAVGAILFEMVTGSRPFGGMTSREILARKLDPGFDPAARAARLGYPEPVLALLRRSLARDPAARFQSAAEFRVVLDTVFAPNGPAVAGAGWAPTMPPAGGLTGLGRPFGDAPMALAPTATGEPGTAAPTVLGKHPSPASGGERPARPWRSIAAVLAALVVAGGVAAALAVAAESGKVRVLRDEVARYVMAAQAADQVTRTTPPVHGRERPPAVGAPDAGTVAAEAPDAGTVAVGAPDAGTVAVGASDAGAVAVGAPDAGTIAVGAPDAGTIAAEAPDAGPVAAEAPDAGTIAAEAPDAGTIAAEAPDAGTIAAEAPDAGADAAEAPDAGAAAIATGATRAERVRVDAAAAERHRHLWLSLSFPCRAISTTAWATCRFTTTNKGYGIRFPGSDVACEEVIFGKGGHPAELRGCRSPHLVLPDRNRLRRSRRGLTWSGSRSGWRWRHSGKDHCCPGLWLKAPKGIAE